MLPGTLTKGQTHGYIYRKSGISVFCLWTRALIIKFIWNLLIFSLIGTRRRDLLVLGKGLWRVAVSGSNYLEVENTAANFCTYWSKLQNIFISYFNHKGKLWHPSKPYSDKILPLLWVWSTGVLDMVVPMSTMHITWGTNQSRLPLLPKICFVKCP